MKKTTLLIGLGIGFVLGSKAGSGPYERLASATRRVARRPELDNAIEHVKSIAKDQAARITRETATKVPRSNGSTTVETGTVMASPTPIKSYADPQDLQFSTAAAEKEETLDAMLAQGVSADELDKKEDELRQDGYLAEPRAGNRAEPSGSV